LTEPCNTIKLTDIAVRADNGVNPDERRCLLVSEAGRALCGALQHLGRSQLSTTTHLQRNITDRTRLTELALGSCA